jgi:hypothetical protein
VYQSSNNTCWYHSQKFISAILTAWCIFWISVGSSILYYWIQRWASLSHDSDFIRSKNFHLFLQKNIIYKIKFLLIHNYRRMAVNDTLRLCVYTCIWSNKGCVDTPCIKEKSWFYCSYFVDKSIVVASFYSL